MKFRGVRLFPLLVNVACFSVALTVSGVVLLKPLHAVRRGFFCDDENVRYPFRPNTISVPLLVLTCFLPAVLIVMGLETAYGVLTVRFASLACSAKDNGSAGSIVPLGTPCGGGGGGGGAAGAGAAGVSGTASSDRSWVEGLWSGLARGGVLTGCLFYGNCLCFSLTEIFKLSFGTLRPSFLAACRPLVDVTALPNCSAGWFVQDVLCQNEDVKVLIEMRKSFISGHASFAVYNVFFIVLYLQRRLPLSTPRLLVSLLQSVATGYAIFVCASRIYDNYHHPPDVVGGAVLGVLCCWVTMFKICPGVIRHPPRTEIDVLPTQGPKPRASMQLTSVQTKE